MSEDPKPDEKEPADESKLEDTIRKIVGKLFGSGELEVEDTEEKPSSEETVKEPSTPRQIEDDMESKVRSVMSKVKQEEVTASRLEKLEELAERPPAELKRLTKFLWGND